MSEPEHARILVVEDEAIVAHDLCRRLARMGYDVVGTVDNELDALDLAATARPTFVLMDIAIQGPRDGIETAVELTRRWDVPVVFLTAHADVETLRRTRQAAPYGYLVKPFDDRELRTAIEIASHRHRVEAEARIFRQAIMTLAAGVAIADLRVAGAPIVSHNEAWLTLTGLGAHEVMNHPCWQALESGAGPGLEELRRAADAGRRGRVTLSLTRRDGPSFWAEVAVNPVLDRAGEVTHLMWSILDVSVRKRGEEAQLHAQKMEAVGRMSAGVAHDFNNILAVIMSCAELAAEALPEDHSCRSDITDIRQAAAEGAALTRQLLTFARQAPSVPRPVDVLAQVSSFLSMIRRSVGATVTVEIDAHSARLFVLMDPVQFNQVLLNLAVNARDAMPAGGRLGIALSSPSAAIVRVVVSDTGLGMDAATRARLFEPFFTTKPVGQGTGLGLATCAAIIEQAGGIVRVESEPGRGTSFIIDLPSIPEASPPAPPAVSSAGVRQRVLVVDDEPLLRRATVRVLEGAGYDVIEATSGDDAIHQMTRLGDNLDAVVTDVVMPVHGGETVGLRARHLAPRAGVLLVTGFLSDAQRSHLAGLDLLWKPFGRPDLIAAVARACERGRQRPAHQASVLLVEDDPCLRDAIGRVLCSAGYEVIQAGTVAAARLAVKERLWIDAVICDQRLPDGTGIELLAELRGGRPDLVLRFAILTGRVTPDLLGAGVLVLAKPIAPASLLDQVRSLISPPARPATP